MDRKKLVSEICDKADGFLDGVTKLEEAKAGIAEWLSINHAGLSPDDRKALVAEVMSILESEGFFEGEAGGES